MGQECYKKTDKCICNTIIKSIDTYEYEVWKMKEKIKKTYWLCKWTSWRRSARPCRREKVRNEIIRENGYKNTIHDDIWAKN
jgi:hypothetical protein